MEKNPKILFNELKNFSKDKLISTKDKKIELTPEEKAANLVYWNKLTGFVIQDFSIDEIIPRLYLSGDDVATNKKILESKNVSHIINMATNVDNKFESYFVYKKISIYDCPSENIMDYFVSTYEFIETALNENSKNVVLCHCNAGNLKLRLN